MMVTKYSPSGDLVSHKLAQSAVRSVIGPHGSRLTLADLPSPSTRRWVIRRKAEVVAAVAGGLLSPEQACSRYALTFDEFLSWQQRLDNFGLVGLRATWTQFYLRNRTSPHFHLRVSRKGEALSGSFG
jgi:Protein of unknown function (DUF1153)